MTRPRARAAAERLVRALTGLLAAQALYPPGHGAIRRGEGAVADALAETLGAREEFALGVLDGYLVLGETAFLGTDAQAAELARTLERRGVEGVVVRAGATAREVSRFLAWLRGEPGGPWSGECLRVVELDRDSQAWRRAKRVYRAAIEALEGAYGEAGQGIIPDAARARACVRDFTELLDEEPSILHGLLLLKDYDHYTFHHSVNVCLLTLGLGRETGLTGEPLEGLGIGALFHDIGKTRTPSAVIRKPSRLTGGEWALVRRHPEHGRAILEEMGAASTAVALAVYEHHLYFGGGGYPAVPAGYRPSALSGLIAVADVYDAMTTHRPYSPPRPLPEAVEIIQHLTGTQLSPDAVRAFVATVGGVPRGSVVRLVTGEVAVVTKLDPTGRACEARIAVDAEGQRVAAAPGRTVAPGEIARWVDPLAYGLDPMAILSREG